MLLKNVHSKSKKSFKRRLCHPERSKGSRADESFQAQTPEILRFAQDDTLKQHTFLIL